ncbi:hypothetical protein [Maricaulis maris]|uniref:hypothetical protein n=1 Tax=Maricaulis maris TaxID=74318 RepID=UPI003B8D02FE
MRIIHVACAGLLSLMALPPVLSQPAEPQTTMETVMVTQWRVSPAPGLDALLLLGAAAGDELQAEYYPESIEFVRSNLDPAALAALDRVGDRMRSRGSLTGPTLALIFSAGPVASLEDIIRSAADPDALLRPGLERSPYWNEDRYAGLQSLLPDVLIVLEGLRTIGFEPWYAAEILPGIHEAVETNHAAVASYDIIPEQTRLLGRELDPQIEILIVQFAQPYGIRIVGQRFLAYSGWPGETQLRIAAHELFHPPFDTDDPALLQRLEALEVDPWVRSIVENHNPAFGYNSFMGVINEDSTQALDQIVSERMGVARDPGMRWRHADDGMHMIAAALYHAMREDGFDQSGGRYSDWLQSALDRGLLSPTEVRRRAAIIVGTDTVDHWYDVAERAPDASE